ncbi:MAG: Mrp/NBP35 family ATP-binding protein [Chloroflexi bacterium]|nr:Mrp/NBP35 family ATP-binding protein [Chloroflexota bacterium]MCI0580686.1 Mrp/NBP35 family ATP-binding protein [Chloroflexota bacterium]MCI0648583.1 Mrp/NBP35 family ATP-binding protein [Chloroflexota bacterium]MCI0727346.1 Mrp/NBP35 family ATP-binding protein [Chloroflexota bacterium]
MKVIDTDNSSTPNVPNVLDQVLAQRQRVADRLAPISHVVAVMSGKGGVGKSALTANLAAALGLAGRSVGVLDADIHGASAAAMLGARGQQVVMAPAGATPAVGVAGVRVMSMDLFLDGDDTPVAWQHPGGLAADAYVWRGTMEANALREFLADTDWGSLDYLLIDMPPGADRFDTLMRLVPGLSGAVVVTIPSQVSHLVVRRAITAARQAGGRLLGLVENMAGLVTPSNSSAETAVQELSPNGGRAFAAEMGIPYWGQVPFEPRLAWSTDAGRPFILEDNQSPAGRAILALAQQLEEALANEISV